MSYGDEILLNYMLQDPLQDNSVDKNIHDEINKYLLLHSLAV